MNPVRSRDRFWHDHDKYQKMFMIRLLINWQITGDRDLLLTR